MSNTRRSSQVESTSASGFMNIVIRFGKYQCSLAGYALTEDAKPIAGSEENIAVDAANLLHSTAVTELQRLQANNLEKGKIPFSDGLTFLEWLQKNGGEVDIEIRNVNFVKPDKPATLKL